MNMRYKQGKIFMRSSGKIRLQYSVARNVLLRIVSSLSLKGRGLVHVRLFELGSGSLNIFLHEKQLLHTCKFLGVRRS